MFRSSMCVIEMLIISYKCGDIFFYKPVSFYYIRFKWLLFFQPLFCTMPIFLSFSLIAYSSCIYTKYKFCEMKSW